MELGEGESGAAAHLPLSGDVALLLLDQLRRIAFRLICGLLRVLLGSSLLFGAGGAFYWRADAKLQRCLSTAV
jgi:hypothetical protein